MRILWLKRLTNYSSHTLGRKDRSWPTFRANLCIVFLRSARNNYIQLNRCSSEGVHLQSTVHICIYVPLVSSTNPKIGLSETHAVQGNFIFDQTNIHGTPQITVMLSSFLSQHLVSVFVQLVFYWKAITSRFESAE